MGSYRYTSHSVKHCTRINPFFYFIIRHPEVCEVKEERVSSYENGVYLSAIW